MLTHLRRNEARFIREKLENTWQLDYPEDRFEVLIGSDGSSDETPALLEACDDRRLRAAESHSISSLQRAAPRAALSFIPVRLERLGHALNLGRAGHDM